MSFSPTTTQKTLNGEPIVDGLPICIPRILMPNGVDMSKWGCVACDQFESQPGYWKEMEEHVGECPSALNIIFPEVYLDSVKHQHSPKKSKTSPSGTSSTTDNSANDTLDDAGRIAKINYTMETYMSSVFSTTAKPAFMAIDRKTNQTETRKGLIIGVDLEAYSYQESDSPLIRPTERTIVSRLPPRIAIREKAPVELPHIIMVIDDPERTVIEPLFEQSDTLLATKDTNSYECNLFKGAGVLKGSPVSEQGTEHVISSLKKLKEKLASQTESAAGEKPALILIGDGNHSLATAKACWDTVKKQPGIDLERHPARYALVELQNLHDPGVLFHPIHRLVENVNPDELLKVFEEEFGVQALPMPDEKRATGSAAGVAHAEVESGHIIFVRKEGKFLLKAPSSTLPVVSMTNVVDDFVKKNPDVGISYIHGMDVVEESIKNSSSQTVGLLLPCLDKSRFLSTIREIKTLPRKAFSMGQADEKRFYVEGRAIRVIQQRIATAKIVSAI